MFQHLCLLIHVRVSALQFYLGSITESQWQVQNRKHMVEVDFLSHNQAILVLPHIIFSH